MSDRNLVVLFDGTWNDTHANTNVKKLYQACSARNQEFNYEEGVGTAHWEALPGGIYGANIDRQILDNYRWLIRRFRDAAHTVDENKLFLFGFSRGSYAARRLAGLIDFSGIARSPQDEELAWQVYLNRDRQTSDALKAAGRLFDVPIEAACMFDTVKTTTDPDFNDKKLPRCVVAGYHAIAIDEKRKFFNVLKWNAESRVRQVWFAGVHADVGGGYAEHGLSDITLKWMIDAAAHHGLRVKASAVASLEPDPNGKLHDSYQGLWLALGKRTRAISKTSLIHESVKERMAFGYRPGNLPDEPDFVSF